MVVLWFMMFNTPGAHLWSAAKQQLDILGDFKGCSHCTNKNVNTRWMSYKIFNASFILNDRKTFLWLSCSLFFARSKYILKYKATPSSDIVQCSWPFLWGASFLWTKISNTFPVVSILLKDTFTPNRSECEGDSFLLLLSPVNMSSTFNGLKTNLKMMPNLFLFSHLLSHFLSPL